MQSTSLTCFKPSAAFLLPLQHHLNPSMCPGRLSALPLPSVSDTTHSPAEWRSHSPPLDSASLPGSLLPQDLCTFCSLCCQCGSSALHSPASLFSAFWAQLTCGILPNAMMVDSFQPALGCFPTPPFLIPFSHVHNLLRFASLTTACLSWLEYKLFAPKTLVGLIYCYVSMA